MDTVNRIKKIQRNLDQAIRCLNAVSQDLTSLHQQIEVTQEETIEHMHYLEDRADTAKQHQTLWGE